MVVQIKTMQKRFGGVVALRNGRRGINAGEVHLLMGENGAGKSTLMKIVAGMLESDGGEMLWQGESAHFHNPAETASPRSAMGPQGAPPPPHLNVRGDHFLRSEPRRPLRWGHR